MSRYASATVYDGIQCRGAHRLGGGRGIDSVLLSQTSAIRLRYAPKTAERSGLHSVENTILSSRTEESHALANRFDKSTTKQSKYTPGYVLNQRRAIER